jgi:GNAT superfamily N-acetyltransferase
VSAGSILSRELGALLETYRPRPTRADRVPVAPPSPHTGSHMDDHGLLDTLITAFLEDPLYRWLYPDENTRPDALRDNLSLTLSLVRERGRVETTADGDGIALWTDPGVELLDDPAPFLELLDRWAPNRVEAALTGVAACGAHGRSTDAVLHVLAVRPDRQGRGVAGRLLAPTLARLDEQGTATYLESSNARNLRFYARCGFGVLGQVRVPDGGPTMYPARRPVDGPGST